MTVQSCLARYVPRAATTPAQLLAMAARAWQDHGIALFRPEDLSDDFDRQAVVNAADRLYGKRGAAYMNGEKREPGSAN